MGLKGRVWSLVVVAGLVAVSCAAGGGGDSLRTTTSSSVEAPTTVEVGETSSTVEETTSTTAGSDLSDQLLALHKDFITKSGEIDTSQEGEWDRLFAWLNENTVDPYRSRAVSAFSESRDRGSELVGHGGISNVTGIDWRLATTPEEVAERGVKVSDCLIGFLGSVNSDGTDDVPEASLFREEAVEYIYDIDTSRFYVSERLSDDVLCDPVDLLKNTDNRFPADPQFESVVSAHNDYLNQVLTGTDTRVDGLGPIREAAGQLAVDPQRQRSLLAVDVFEEEGWQLDGEEFESTLVAVRVNGDEASVLDCARLAYSIFDSAGELVFPPDDHFEYRETFLVKVRDQWRVKFYWSGGQECDPGRY